CLGPRYSRGEVYSRLHNVVRRYFDGSRIRGGRNRAPVRYVRRRWIIHQHVLQWCDRPPSCVRWVDAQPPTINASLSALVVQVDKYHGIERVISLSARILKHASENVRFFA